MSQHKQDAIDLGQMAVAAMETICRATAEPVQLDTETGLFIVGCIRSASQAAIRRLSAAHAAEEVLGPIERQLHEWIGADVHLGAEQVTTVKVR